MEQAPDTPERSPAANVVAPPASAASPRGVVGPWYASLIYAAGIWVLLTLWAAIAPLVASPSHIGPIGGFPLLWALVINLIPALICGAGFRLGLIGAGHRAGRGRRASAWIAFAFGLVFPVTVVLLRPLFLRIGFGIFPPLAWTLLGSVLVALLFRRVVAR